MNTFSILKSSQRGYADHGWLKSFHTFSFAGYHNPNFMNFGNLRVINQDSIEGGSGFSTHPHKNMEIISYVLEGALEHTDSMGNSTVIKPGEIQRMSAGTGITHSEHNHEKLSKTLFFQIWVLPATPNTEPSYGQKDFTTQLATQKPVLVLASTSHPMANNVVTCNQNIEMYAAKIDKETPGPISLESKYSTIWLQVISGSLSIENKVVSGGDALYGNLNQALDIQILEDAHFFYFLQ
jgi:quercetin 2,3-dioxygenase